MTEEKTLHMAGFWIRLAAIGIDSLVVVGAAYLVVVSARAYAHYVPLEILAVALALSYSAILIGAHGQTIGKFLCGLHVLRKDGKPVNYFTGILRELIGKPVIALMLPFGLPVAIIRVFGASEAGGALLVLFSLFLFVFYVMYFVKTKRTWYDDLSGTFVQQEFPRKKRDSLVLALVATVSASALLLQTIVCIKYYGLYSDLLPYSSARPASDDRDPGRLIDVSSLEPSKNPRFVRWLDANAFSPVDYAVQAASTHQLVVFGEMHNIKSQISFLAEAIPALYHRAGVRCIALETCTQEDNEELAELVTAPEYDHERALRIARNQPWQLWGWKEYWDVLYAVWYLNRGLPESEKKLRVVGLDNQFDGPSFALSIAGDDAAEGPLWEKLRIFRALWDFPFVLLRDQLMAREAERQIIGTGDRGIVWCGAMHSFINYKQPHNQGRMAYMLRRKHGDKVFQILFHSRDFAPSTFGERYAGPPPRMGDFIERVMAQRGDSPAGFTVAGSPFEFLRDSSHYYFWRQPKTALGDVATGYIYFESRAKFKDTQWTRGFITPSMFATNKPFYEAKARRTFATAEEADEFIAGELESK